VATRSIQFFYPKLPYDTFKDFTAISEVAASPLAIVVAKNSPVKNLQELLGIARDKPELLSYGMSGNGTSAHLAGELLNYMAKVKILAIPYKGLAMLWSIMNSVEIPDGWRNSLCRVSPKCPQEEFEMRTYGG